MELEIIYRDEHLIAINKPAGLLVHRSNLDRRATQFAMQLLRDQIGQHVFTVHRIDRPTSGVLLFALNSEIAKLMSIAFKEKEMRKRYLAVVRGYTEASGKIDYPLLEVKDKFVQQSEETADTAYEAITGYKLLSRLELDIPMGRHASSRYSLLAVFPRTGRRHQIRRHFKHIFHPIIGDVKYGDGKHNRLFREKLNSHRLLLHAHKLEFKHPVTNENISIRAELDETFTKVIDLFPDGD